jgi:hypothetical protein
VAEQEKAKQASWPGSREWVFSGLFGELSLWSAHGLGPACRLWERLTVGGADRNVGCSICV